MARRRRRTLRKLWRSLARKLPYHLRLALGIRLKKRKKRKETEIRKEVDNGKST